MVKTVHAVRASIVDGLPGAPLSEEPKLRSTVDLIGEITDFNALRGVMIAELLLPGGHLLPFVGQSHNRVRGTVDVILRRVGKPLP
jgi:hypothetical protein